jgi:hypothetical protein
MNTSRFTTWWMQYRLQVFWIVIALMATAAAWKLGNEFYRLVWDPGPIGAVDLKHLHRWVTSWFAGQPTYQQSNAAQYPPATYIMLWPLLGWMSFNAARWFWAATSVLALAATILLIVRISGAETRREQIFVALLLLSINGTGVAIGSGQLILHLLPALLAGVLVLEREHETLGADLAAGGLFTWAMIKPSVGAPFLWVLLFAWKRRRPVLLVLLIYAVLTLAAVTFQKENVPTLLKLCLAKATTATTLYPATRNIHSALVAAGFEKWLILGSALIFVALGVWTYRYRRADRWVLMAVTALVARMWTYHRVYDDVLILLPELALFRIAKRSSSPQRRTIAEVLLVLTALAMLCPARLLDQPTEWPWTSDWAWVFTGAHTILWLLILGYLVNYARQDCVDA